MFASIYVVAKKVKKGIVKLWLKDWDIDFE